jgi:hypothetical protein
VEESAGSGCGGASVACSSTVRIDCSSVGKSTRVAMTPRRFPDCENDVFETATRAVRRPTSRYSEEASRLPDVDRGNDLLESGSCLVESLLPCQVHGGRGFGFEVFFEDLQGHRVEAQRERFVEQRDADDPRRRSSLESSIG